MTMPDAFPSVVHMLAHAAGAHPHKEALVCGGDRLTYAQYATAVARFASELAGLGASGGRVALILPNSTDFAIAAFASLAAGAQTAPLNPLYTAHELGEILQDCQPDVVLVAPEAREKIASLTGRLALGTVIEIGPQARSLRDGAAGPAATVPLPAPDALGILQYTGGTTGKPKGVDITHRATATNVSQRQAVVPIGTDDRLLVMTPLYHVYASSMGLFAAAYAAATLVILPRYTPEIALTTIGRERISFFAGSPTIYHGLLAHPLMERTDFSELSLCFSGASALPAKTLEDWERRTGSVICEGFGQTETGPVIAANPRDGVRKAGSVGVILPNTEVEIVDPVDGVTPCAPLQNGEIRVRGPQLMTGYRNRPEETAQTIRDGWLYTGDIGFIDADGYLTISDRKKDMVIVSGFNVFPREIEEVLYTCPGVREVAAFGVPHVRKGEAIHVHVVAPGLSAGAIEAFLAERLTRYKIPSSVEIVSELPKTAIGKVDKAALRRAAQADGRATGP